MIIRWLLNKADDYCTLFVVVCVVCNFPTHIASQMLRCSEMATPSFTRQGYKRSDAEILLSGKHLGHEFHQLFDVRSGNTKAALEK